MVSKYRNLFFTLTIVGGLVRVTHNGLGLAAALAFNVPSARTSDD
jgi:hypothetical protein